MKNKKKILILGATGFIGKNLVIKFSKLNSYEIHAVSFKSPQYKVKGVKWYKADLRNKNQISKIIKGINIVIQAAATTSGSKDIINRPFVHITDNVIMNSYLLQLAYENKIDHLIFFSCSVMYHSSKKALKESDYDPNKQLNKNYFASANTKLYIEKLCQFYSDIGDTKYTVIRHSNIFGPYDKFDLERSHFFGATITKTLTSEKNITIWGDGEEGRDLLYVSDLMNFVYKSLTLQTKKFRIYNCGSGKIYKIKEIANKIIEKTKNDKKIIFDLSKPTIKTNVFLDINLAKKELKWKPEISLEKGIKKTISWYKKNVKIDKL